MTAFTAICMQPSRVINLVLYRPAYSLILELLSKNATSASSRSTNPAHISPIAQNLAQFSELRGLMRRVRSGPGPDQD